MRRSARLNKNVAGSNKAQPLASFSSLPYEIRERIVQLACDSDCAPFFIDRDTARSLMLVSHGVYARTTPHFFKNVRITRPSSLADFARTLTSRPELGKLVKSLYLGADCHLSHQWWPMRYLDADEPQLRLREMTTSLEEKDLLPRWCGPRRAWSLTNVDADLTRRDYAVLGAIESAQISLGVNLRHPRRDYAGNRIGSIRFLVGCMEVQAALDLYLIEMRRIEDAARLPVPHHDGKRFSTQSPTDQGPWPRYPPLVFTGTLHPSSPEHHFCADSVRPFVLDHTRLVDHLARRGGDADYFDHPLIAARSGLHVLAFDDIARARPSSAFEAQLRKMYEGQTEAFVPMQADRPSSPPIDLTACTSSSPATAAGPPTATVAGILQLARSVLAATPQVQHLFLTGFLQQLLCGRNACSPPSLVSLGLGPLSFGNDHSLSPSFEGGRLRKLERLYISGTSFAKHKISALSALPSLTEVEWALQHFCGRFPDLWLVLRPLFNEAKLAESASLVAAIATRSTGSSDNAGETRKLRGVGNDVQEASAQRKPPLVTVWLSAESLGFLSEALTVEARGAINSGDLVCEEPLGLQIKTMVNTSTLLEGRWDIASGEVEAVYGDLKDEWEYCVTGRWPWDEDED